MIHKKLIFCVALGAMLCAGLAPAQAQAQKSETVQQLEVLRDIIASQNKSIEALAGALAQKQQPVFVGGMPMQQPQPVAAEEKACEDSLIGCAMRGLGSILLRAGNKGIDFLDRNAVPLLQVVAQDRSAARGATAAIETARFGYMERRDVAQANAATNQALGVNLQNVALSGFGTIGALPPQAVNTWNVSGTGINFGNGTLNYNPVTDSYNPVNPNSRTCAIVNNVYSCL